MDRVTIDRKALFALASETRIEILKRLDSRRMTLSELSKDLNLSKTTIKEHLDRLMEAGLIIKMDEGRKWVYYELTDNGKRILHPKRETKIIFLLSSAIASISGGLIELFRFFSLSKPQMPAPTPVPPSTPTPTPPLPVPTPSIEAPIIPEMHLIAGMILILVGIAIIWICMER